MNSYPEVVELKDLTFELARFIAVGVGVVPESNFVGEMYTLALWLSGVHEPITITYATIEERDTELEIIKSNVIMRS